MRPSVVAMTLACWGCQCGSDTASHTSPLVEPPSSSELAAIWAVPVTETTNPNQRCAPCHEDIVTSYQKSPKGQTSRPPEPVKSLDPVTFGRLSVSATSDGAIIQSETGPYGGRQAKASLQIGSASHNFASMINGTFRLLPLMRQAPEHNWIPTSGFRGQLNQGFESDVLECAECHGLHQTQPSLHGITCDTCHGNLDQHAKTPSKALSNPIHDRLKSSSGQGELCGRCHTLVNARISGLQGQPNFLNRPAMNTLVPFRAYERDTQLDERIAGQYRRLRASKCFDDDNTVPKCSDCRSTRQSNLQEDPNDLSELSYGEQALFGPTQQCAGKRLCSMPLQCN